MVTPSLLLRKLRLKQGVAFRGYRLRYLLCKLPCKQGVATETHPYKLLDVFPVPRLVEIRTETELVSIMHKPLVNRRLDLDRAVWVLRLDRVTSNIEIQSTTREVWAVHCKSSATGIWRLTP